MLKKGLSAGLCLLILSSFVPAVWAANENDIDRLNKTTPKDFGNVKTSDESNAFGRLLNFREIKKNLTVRPYFKQGFKLTNNVFHDPNGEKSTNSTQTTRKMDVIWSETPGINATYKKDRTLISGFYEAEFNYFTKYSGQNAQNQTAGAAVQFAPSENTYIKAKELFSQKDITSGFISLKPVSVTENDFTMTAGYKKDAWTFEADYRNFVRHFPSDTLEQFNYIQNEYGFTSYYQWDEHLKPYMRTKLIQVDYPHDEDRRDAAASDSRLGLISQWKDQRLEFRGDAGVYLRENRHSDDVNDPDYFVASFLARKTIFKKTVLEAGFFREVREAAFQTATTYADNAVYFGVSHPVSKKFILRGNVIGELRRYPDATLSGGQFMKRRDDVLGLNLGADYVFSKRAALRVDYKLDRQDSNFEALSYTENSLLSKLILTL